jgi:hypothetical protein
MPEPPGQIRSRRTRSLHTHQVHIPFLCFFFSLTSSDPFFLPPSIPLTLHLSLSHFMLSSFPLCLIPLLPLLHRSPCIVILITHPLHPFFPIFMTFYSIPFHSTLFHDRDLSGGQKARVVFVELSLMAPHLLFLDVRHSFFNSYSSPLHQLTSPSILLHIIASHYVMISINFMCFLLCVCLRITGANE